MRGLTSMLTVAEQPDVQVAVDLESGSLALFGSLPNAAFMTTAGRCLFAGDVGSGEPKGAFQQATPLAVVSVLFPGRASRPWVWRACLG